MERLSTLKLVKKLAGSVKNAGYIDTNNLEAYSEFCLKVMYAPNTDELCITKKAGKTKVKVKGTGIFESCSSVNIRFGGNSEFDSYVCIVPLKKNDAPIFSGEPTRGFICSPLLKRVSEENLAIYLYYKCKADDFDSKNNLHVIIMASADVGLYDLVYTLATTRNNTIRTAACISSIAMELQRNFGSSKLLRFKKRGVEYVVGDYLKALVKEEKKIKKHAGHADQDALIKEARRLYIRCGGAGD